MLTGCASLTTHRFKVIPWSKRQSHQQQVKHWSARGSINIHLPQNSQSAYFKWHFQAPDHYRLYLFGPLGIGSTQLKVTPKQAQLITSQGKRFTAASAQALLNEYTHWRLPVNYLFYWVRALVVPKTAVQKRQLNDFNQLIKLKQHNWTIDYFQYQPIKPGLDLPQKMKLKGQDLTATITINHWQLKT